MCKEVSDILNEIKSETGKLTRTITLYTSQKENKDG